MTKIRTIIIDDEFHSIQLFRNLLNKHKSFELVDTCSNYTEAIDSIIDKLPDLIFLDFHLGGKNGFDLLEELRDIGYVPDVIFISAHDMALSAYRYCAIDYILKPIDVDIFKQSLRRYLCNHKPEIKRIIKFKTHSGLYIRKTGDIMACKAEGNYSRLFYNNSGNEMVTIQLGRLKELLDDEIFFRIHRSIIINIDYLDCIKNDQVILRKGDNELRYPLSKDHKKELEKAL